MFLRSTLLAAAAVFCLTGVAMAQDAATPAATPAVAAPAPEAAKAPGPCKQIAQACMQAGFVKGGHKDGKGLKMDCMQPLMEGKTVAGVTVAGDMLAACKEKRAKWHEMHKEGMMGGDKPMMPAGEAAAPATAK